MVGFLVEFYQCDFRYELLFFVIVFNISNKFIIFSSLATFVIVIVNVNHTGF